MTISLFTRLEIETSSYCNRRCPTCIRNSIPNKTDTESWFQFNELSFDIIEKVLKEAVDLGFRGEVCLSHYNEPLFDKRISEIGRLTRDKNFSRVFMCSNGDYLTDALAEKLDGVFHDIGFTLYDNFSERSKKIKSLFKNTKLILSDGKERMITHHSPMNNTQQLASQHSNNPCFQPGKRFIVNHKGDVLLCCDDLTGHFSLGNVNVSSISDLWFSDKHQLLVQKLHRAGGRMISEWCMSCPRER